MPTRNLADMEIPAPPPGAATQAAKREPVTTAPLTSDPSVVPAAAPKPAPPVAPANICPTCGHRNRPGTLICENCGTSLIGRPSALGTRDLKREENQTPDSAKLLDTGQVRAVESAGSSAFADNMVLRIEIEGGGTPMLVYPKQEIILGRRDPNSGGMPDVDLTAYAGYRMGVSRRHAAIRLQDKFLHVSDLGSSNGTFLNGTRLAAHRPYQLRDGDEVRLGQLVLKLYFQVNKSQR